MRAVRHYLEAILSARSRSRRLLILAFKVQPRYLDWRERGGMKKREGGGLTMAREEERERKTTMSSNWIKISPTKGDETRGVHSFASTRTFRESKRGSALDFHVGLRNNSRRGWWQLCHASNVPLVSLRGASAPRGLGASFESGEN